MKFTIPAIVAWSLLTFATAGYASERHDADKALETNLRATLDQRHVHVHVHDGIVTLEGRVRTDTDRQSIESMVRTTPGVAAVKDQLKVALPEPGVVAAPVRSTIPVYTTPPPEVIAPAPVVTTPAPVVIPDYPRLKVQAYTENDLPLARQIARQMSVDAVPTAGLEHVNITVREGTVTLKGQVESHEDRDALIDAIQDAGGMRAIYDQLQVE